MNTSQRDILPCDMFFYALYLAEEANYSDGYYDAYKCIEQVYRDYPKLRPESNRVKYLKSLLLKKGAKAKSKKCIQELNEHQQLN